MKSKKNVIFNSHVKDKKPWLVNPMIMGCRNFNENFKLFNMTSDFTLCFTKTFNAHIRFLLPFFSEMSTRFFLK